MSLAQEDENSTVIASSTSPPPNTEDLDSNSRSIVNSRTIEGEYFGPPPFHTFPSGYSLVSPSSSSSRGSGPGSAVSGDSNNSSFGSVHSSVTFRPRLEANDSSSTTSSYLSHGELSSSSLSRGASLTSSGFSSPRSSAGTSVMAFGSPSYYAPTSSRNTSISSSSVPMGYNGSNGYDHHIASPLLPYNKKGIFPPSSFPTYVLGLLTSLELDPSGLAGYVRNAPEAASYPHQASDRPPEADAILSSIARLAERLAKSEAHNVVGGGGGLYRDGSFGGSGLSSISSQGCHSDSIARPPISPHYSTSSNSSFSQVLPPHLSPKSTTGSTYSASSYGSNVVQHTPVESLMSSEHGPTSVAREVEENPWDDTTTGSSSNRYPVFDETHVQSRSMSSTSSTQDGIFSRNLLHPRSGSSGEEGATPVLTAEQELRLLKAQVLDIARVCKAVARGDLSQKIEVNVQGHDLIELKEIINGMVDNLNGFSKEVTRVSLEVGTDG